jgi:hypothetical protein
VKSITTLAPVRSVARPLTDRADPADAARSEDDGEILLLLAETRLSAAGPGPAAVRTRERPGRMLK